MIQFEPKHKIISFFLIILVLTDFFVFFDIPLFKPIFVFFLVTLIPGVIIVILLSLDQLKFIEKVVLSTGISISFILFSALFMNFSLSFLHFQNIFNQNNLLILYNISIVVLLGLFSLKKGTFSFKIPEMRLSSKEKVLLLALSLIYISCISGIYFLNSYNLNFVIIFFYLVVSAFIIFIAYFNKKIPKRMYPVIILIISLTIFLVSSLRSDHLLGSDTHEEFYHFLLIINNSFWMPDNTLLGSCLSISILPAVYQFLIGGNPEFLFKLLFSLLFLIAPLSVYAIINYYFDEFYSFIGTLFFIFQYCVVGVPEFARSSIALLFCILFLLILFNKNIIGSHKSALLILFFASCVVSHYSTSYIFFIIMVLVFFLQLFIKHIKIPFQQNFQIPMLIIFFMIIYFWYFYVNTVVSSTGVSFVTRSIESIRDFFDLSDRGNDISFLLGNKIQTFGQVYQVEVALTWALQLIVTSGLFAIIFQKFYSLITSKKSDEIIPCNREIQFDLISFACIFWGLLASSILIPFISIGYGILRVYALASVLLSIFFIVGSQALANMLINLKCSIQQKMLLKIPLIDILTFKKEKSNKIVFLIIVLPILIFYFLSISGITYSLAGFQRSMYVNSGGSQFDIYYISDQESVAAKWLKNVKLGDEEYIYSDYFEPGFLLSQSMIEDAQYR